MVSSSDIWEEFYFFLPCFSPNGDKLFEGIQGFYNFDGPKRHKL